MHQPHDGDNIYEVPQISFVSAVVLPIFTQ
jgi:hypothetical protein